MLTPFQNRAARALRATPFFGDLDPESLEAIHRVGVRRGEALFETGEASDHLYGVISGHLKLFSEPARGREIALGFVAPGELLGDLGVLQGEPQYAGVKALANTELAAVTRRSLASLLQRQPQLAAGLIDAASRTTIGLARRAADVAFLSIEERLENALDDLADRLGETVEHGTRIKLRQRDIADLLGVSRESVNRLLTSSRMRGRVELGRGSIVLLSS